MFDRPVIDAETATLNSPDPGRELHGAVEPYASVGPYSKWQSVTVWPLGFTVAFNVAELVVTADASSVTTAGGACPSANAHAAPTLLLSEGPPISGVLPWLESATLLPK